MPPPIETNLGNLPNSGGPIYSISSAPIQTGGNLIITNFSNIYNYLTGTGNIPSVVQGNLTTHIANQAAHGATSANTASAIVARDSGGNTNLTQLTTTNVIVPGDGTGMVADAASLAGGQGFLLNPNDGSGRTWLRGYGGVRISQSYGYEDVAIFQGQVYGGGITFYSDVHMSTRNISGAGAVTATSFAGYGIVPVGGVISWLLSFTGTPALPDGWVQCNGQTLSDAASPYNGAVIPNLNGASAGTHRFLRGSTTSGSTGGSETHTHTIAQTSICTGASTSTSVDTAATTGSTSTLPSYYEVVYIMRVK